MTRSIGARRIGWWLAILAALAAAPALALKLETGPGDPQDGWDVEQLMDALARQHGESGEASFTEIKTLASLKEPLVARGVLRYRLPASLEKEVQKPRAERYVINNESMEIYRDGKLRRQVTLENYPEVRNFVRSFIATLGGDLAALRQHYDVQLEGRQSDWTLHLTPTDEALRGIVKRITVQGQAGEVLSFETLQPDDDRSKMLITPQG